MNIYIKNQVLLLMAALLLFSCVKLYSQKELPSDKFEQVRIEYFDSETLGETRVLFVYVPDNVTADSKYPVLYLLDGERVDRFGEALTCVQNNKIVGQHIIVGIQTVKNRNRDMIPVKMESRPEAGEAYKFLQFLVTELQPYIDEKFDTNGENIIYGASTAGLFPLYAMLESPGSFLGYISSSTMVGHCPEFLEKKAIDFKPKDSLNDRYLYIHYGMKDHFKQVTYFLPEYYTLLEELFGKNLTMKVKCLKDMGHVPAGGIEEGLGFIYLNKNGY